jgi:hypothetical protein
MAALSDVDVFEVDHPATQSYKRRNCSHLPNRLVTFPSISSEALLLPCLPSPAYASRSRSHGCGRVSSITLLPRPSVRPARKSAVVPLWAASFWSTTATLITRELIVNAASGGSCYLCGKSLKSAGTPRK